jgi:hypothetical protein
VRDRCKSQSLGGHHGRRSAKLKDIILGSRNQALDAGLRVFSSRVLLTHDGF